MMTNLYSDATSLSTLIDSSAIVKMQDIVDDENDIIAGRLPLISFNIDRIEPATTFYSRFTIVYNLRITFMRGDYDSLHADDLIEVGKVANFVHALSQRGYEPSSIEIIKRGTEFAVTYLCTLDKSIKSKSC